MGSAKASIRGGHQPQRVMQPAWKCNECQRSFSTKGNLLRHVQAAHVGGQVFPCPVCGKNFKRKEDMKTHMRIHTGEKPYQCGRLGCNKRFARVSDLRSHERTHDANAKAFACKHPGCGKSFTRPYDLKKHDLSQHQCSPYNSAALQERRRSGFRPSPTPASETTTTKMPTMAATKRPLGAALTASAAAMTAAAAIGTPRVDGKGPPSPRIFSLGVPDECRANSSSSSDTRSNNSPFPNSSFPNCCMVNAPVAPTREAEESRSREHQVGERKMSIADPPHQHQHQHAHPHQLHKKHEHHPSSSTSSPDPSSEQLPPPPPPPTVSRLRKRARCEAHKDYIGPVLPSSRASSDAAGAGAGPTATATASATAGEAGKGAASSDSKAGCDVHLHGSNCGHVAVLHDDHLDFLVEGGQLECYDGVEGNQKPREGWVSMINTGSSGEVAETGKTLCGAPDESRWDGSRSDKPRGNCPGNAHGPQCGHDVVQHDGHLDYVVNGRLLHPIGSDDDDGLFAEFEDHGSVKALDDDFLTFYETLDVLNESADQALESFCDICDSGQL